MNAKAYDQFILHKRIVVKDLPIFKQVAMQYHFKNFAKGQSPDTIIFAKPDCIFTINFETEAITTLFTFDVPLTKQPSFFQTNTD